MHRLVRLGYPDSGMRNEHAGFASLPVAEPAGRLAEVLAEERADLLLGYDPNGGYGHPDHRQVHRVARRPASWSPAGGRCCSRRPWTGRPCSGRSGC